MKRAGSNCGRGISLVTDAAAYKDEILKKQEEVKVEEDSTDLFMQKMKEAGLEANPEEEVKKPDEQ